MTNTIKLWFYPGANPNNSAVLWNSYEVDISQYVRRPGQDGGSPVTYSWGKQDESTQTDTGQMSLTLDNRDGRFSTENVPGPYYGQIDTNTPIRLGVQAGLDNFNRTVTAATGPAAGWGTINAALGQSWVNPSGGTGTTTYSVDGTKAQVNVTGGNIFTLAEADGMQARDVDITTVIYPSGTATGAAYSGGHFVRYTDNSNYYRTSLEFNTNGTASLHIRKISGGVLTDIGALDPIPSSSYSAGVPWVMRTQAEGGSISIKAWPVAAGPSGGWQVSIADSANTGTRLGIYAHRLNGNTNTGNFIAFDDFTATSIEWTGFVTAWPMAWDQTGNNSWAKITANGILSRLRQGTNPVQSPLFHQLSATADAVSYWPMEEGSDAVFFANSTTGGRPGLFGDVSPGSDTTLAGGGQAPTLSTDQGVIRLPVTPGVNSGGTGFSAMVLFKLPSVPSTKTRIITVSPRSGPVATYAFSCDATGTYLETLDSSGTVTQTAANFYAADFTEWIAWQLEVDNTAGGGNTSVAGIYHRVAPNAGFAAQTLTVSGTTLSNIGGMTLTGAAGTAFAHAWLGQNTLPFVTSSFAQVSSGYANEAAADRFARICLEAGISYVINGNGVYSTQPMGPQKESKTMDVLQSCVDADYAVMIERGAGLEFIPKDARWNAAKIYTLSKSSGEIGAIPQPVRDEQRLKNSWTVSRINGSSATYADASSVARNGTWEDSANLNLNTDIGLDSQASWRVFIGTNQRARWASVTLNFARSPQLMKIWRQRYYGWRFGITTSLTQMTGNEPDLIMEGFQATLDPDIWTVDMNCTSAAPWQVGVLDTNVLDAGYTTLGGSLNTTATTLILSMSSVYEQWKPGASTAVITVDYEDIALGTIGSITGSGPWTQTVTGCTRSVNGRVTTHASGETVKVKSAIRATL